MVEFQENVSLAQYTSFRIGGPARYFFIAKNKEELIEAIKKAKGAKLPIFILGGGNNVLAPDKGYQGLVIKIQNSEIKIQDSNIQAEAGAVLVKLVSLATNKSLTGLEWAAGIPGTIGGAVYGNAQAFGTKISDIIKEVEVLDNKSLEIKTLVVDQCNFSEKKSIFKENKDLIVLSVNLELKKGNKDQIKQRIKKHLEFRKKNQPLEFPSAGSVFINQDERPASSSLVDKAGLKGLKIGDAQVSEKHAGFIVNLGKAKSEDVLKLIKIIKQKVKEKFNIDLEPEIQIIE
jgi:UDP-N-acetylmuramate dehydrogenase